MLSNQILAGVAAIFLLLLFIAGLGWAFKFLILFAIVWIVYAFYRAYVIKKASENPDGPSNPNQT